MIVLSFHFSEASDWEAKFYQIQSKYLLILNELHNPQVSVSASRQEMVGQLLKDIVEATERPALTSNATSAFDQFGFRIILDSSTTATDAAGADKDKAAVSLEDKVERLRRQAEEASENVTQEVLRIFAVFNWENLRIIKNIFNLFFV